MRQLEGSERGGALQGRTLSGGSAASRSALKVKEVLVDGRRYVVCVNEDQAKKDAADREAIIAGARKEASSGATGPWWETRASGSILQPPAAPFSIDEEKVEG